MSFDLTNKNIQDTFQNLLQKTGSDGRLFDLEGNQVNDLTLTNLSASGHISASKFIGDGSELSGVVSGIEVKSNGTSVGTSLTAINFVHTGEITTGSGGITTVTTWEVFDTWLYGGG